MKFKVRNLMKSVKSCEHVFPSREQFEEMIHELYGKVESVAFINRCMKCDKLIWTDGTTKKVKR